MAGRDDDALMWDGDDDPTLDVGASDAAEPDPDAHAAPATGETAVLPEGWNAVGRGSDGLAANESSPVGSTQPTALPPSTPASNVELIALGLIGGFFLLYSIGWLIGALRLQGTAEFLVAPVAYQVSLWLAAAAPLVWFAAVYALTPAKVWVRFLWLIGGVVLLVPWPFIMVGAIGQ